MWKLNGSKTTKKKIKEEILKIPWDKWKWKHNIPKSMGFGKSSSKRKVYSDTSLPQETRKISNKWSNFTPKGTKKVDNNKSQS